MTQPKTVKVRIAVAVNSKGEYAALGQTISSTKWIGLTVDEILGGAGLHIVTAELPIPSIPEVQGEVEVVK